MAVSTGHCHGVGDGKGTGSPGQISQVGATFGPDGQVGWRTRSWQERE